VTNSGTTSLNITGVTTNGAHPGDFIVVSSPRLPFCSGRRRPSRFDSIGGALGERTATLHVLNDDADEPDYDFAFAGLAWNGDCGAGTTGR
jgi:hypothetical protein